ncbi:hypothetical protein A3F64_03245 [Candidatus Saccharibacteria bacterium RIFCSPHIGHO2_12_FULL_42_8]|nr:MAG: hypothetical protein A3F64_03245 [Candidatus Saccharibacteria bacterium RIFCSPHIGHO2_12_FULL_42_8]
MPRPTKKQTELLEYLKGFIAGYGYGPSYREIQKALGYSSVSTVATHIEGLIKAGKIRKKDFSARSLEIVETSNNLTQSQQKWLIKKGNDLGFEKIKKALNSYVHTDDQH